MTCFGGNEDLMYLTEITVERLLLREHKFKEDFINDPPLVKIKFLDFPVFVIGPRPHDPCAVFEPEPYDENVGMVYMSGKSCLFVMKPNSLVRCMRLKPLSIGVFRGDETFPLAESSIAMSGCLCDQVAMAKNDNEHRPAPFEMFGSYVLLDPGKSVAGHIKIFFRLTLFGDYIISHYQLNRNSITFKNDYDGEMRVVKIPEKGEDDDDDISCEGEGEGEGEAQCASVKSHSVLPSVKSGNGKSIKSGNGKSIKSGKNKIVT